MEPASEKSLRRLSTWRSIASAIVCDLPDRISTSEAISSPAAESASTGSSAAAVLRSG